MSSVLLLDTRISESCITITEAKKDSRIYLTLSGPGGVKFDHPFEKWGFQLQILHLFKRNLEKNLIISEPSFFNIVYIAQKFFTL